MTRTQMHQLAKRYARAALNVWKTPLTVAECENCIVAAQYIQGIPRIQFFLQLPLIEDAIKEKILQKVRKAYAMPEWIDKLIGLLIKQKRVFLAPFVYEYIALQAYEDAHYMQFTVFTSIPLPPPQQLICTHFIHQRTGYKPLTAFIIDTSLIAGIRIQSVAYLWEYSVNNCLRSYAYHVLP
jgi:F0F1-type ATP synthase delta subunit